MIEGGGGGLDPKRGPCRQGVVEGYEIEGQECISHDTGKHQGQNLKRLKLF